jgi:minor extracellular serine protease Vpr
MRFRLPHGRGVLAAAVAVFALAVPATMAGADGAQLLAEVQAAGTGQPTFEGTGAWFVELKSGSSAANFRSDAKGSKLEYSERFAYDRLWKGLSVRVSSDQLDELEGLGSVKALYPVLEVPMPETDPVASPDLETAIEMTGADIAQNTLGLSGEGVKVAVMDTGIDVDHADLGGDGVTGGPESGDSFPNSRITHGFDFVGDAFNASGSGAALVPNPDPNPDDCEGHGSHVAGIVGADGEVTGVAPGVTFGAYRVFGCSGSTTSDIMLAAMERALADGMDVLNMSIGFGGQGWPQYPTAVASDALVDAGMVVVASIGNNGANGVLSAGAPGVGNKVIGVASYDNVEQTFRVFRVTPDNAAIGYLQASGAPLAPTSGTDAMARTGTQTSTADACTALPAGSLTGFVALIRRGTCGFYFKALNAMNAGAEGVVIYNNVPGHPGGITVDPALAVPPGTVPITIPVVSISGTQGNLIDTRLASGPVTMTWTDEFLRVANPTTGGLISSFSSYGLAADLSLKPDLGAPGGFILSTIPIEKGTHGSNSGTSMSSPHVAGAAALLKEARPSLAPASFRDVLQNSADPKPWQGNPGLGFLDQVHRQGAGMLDIDDSVLSTTTVTPAKLALGEGNGPFTRTLTLQNSSGSAVTYNVTHSAALATGPSAAPAIHPFAFGVFSAPSTVALPAQVTVPAGGSATVEATITPNAALGNLAQYGGYVVFTPSGDGQVYRVPFAGMKGDYQTAVVMPVRAPFPTIGQEVEPGGFDIADPAEVWDLQSMDEIPNVLLHFDHHPQRLEIEVLKANGQKVHPVFSNMHEEEFLPRNLTPTGFFAYPWNGTRLHSNGNKGKRKEVPDGQYKLVAKALKPLGDAANPAHWETWTSPTITINRP